jgi:hypothetical protein
MKNKIKGLVLTYCYPPFKSPESNVTFRLLNSLSKFIDITVLRPQYDLFEKKNPENSYLKEIKVETPEIINKFLNIKRLPIRPDRFIFYYPSFRNYLSKMDLSNFDFFMTRSQFHSNHLLDLFLKKKIPGKLIMEIFNKCDFLFSNVILTLKKIMGCDGLLFKCDHCDF